MLGPNSCCSRSCWDKCKDVTSPSMGLGVSILLLCPFTGVALPCPKFLCLSSLFSSLTLFFFPNMSPELHSLFIDFSKLMFSLRQCLCILLALSFQLSDLVVQFMGIGMQVFFRSQKPVAFDVLRRFIRIFVQNWHFLGFPLTLRADHWCCIV